VIVAHIGGMPVEETLLQLAPAGIGVLIALQVALARLVSRVRRFGHGIRRSPSADRI
jgi:hypothetical protein